MCAQTLRVVHPGTVVAKSAAMTIWRATFAVVVSLAAAAPAAAQYKRYLAEGATGPFFATKLSLANPDEVNAASVVLTFDSGQGTTRTMPLSLAPGGTAF